MNAEGMFCGQYNSHCLFFFTFKKTSNGLTRPVDVFSSVVETIVLTSLPFTVAERYAWKRNMIRIMDLRTKNSTLLPDGPIFLVENDVTFLSYKIKHFLTRNIP